MTVLTRQVIPASCFEGNSTNRKTRIEAQSLRGEAGKINNRSTALNRLRRSKLVPLPQSVLERFPHSETLLSTIPFLQQIAAAELVCTI